MTRPLPLDSSLDVMCRDVERAGWYRLGDRLAETVGDTLSYDHAKSIV